MNDGLKDIERGAEALDALLKHQRPEIETDAEGRISQASALVGFVESRAELFRDENGDVYAQDLTSHEARRIDGRQFRDWLAGEFYSSTGKSARDSSIREAVSTLGGLGRARGECRKVWVRVGQHGNDYYLDLAESGRSRAVRLSTRRWEVVDHPPLTFVRSEAMQPLPVPEAGASIGALWRIANVPRHARLLVLAWLIEALRPDTPFPLLELIGEQGSAKSTTQKAFRRLIDPNACDLRGAPKTSEDVFVSAGASWLVSLENISYLSAPMQDSLCVLATGGGHAKRKLYSDADEVVIHVKRPIILNGISVAVTAQDLIDRTVSLELPPVRERLETTDLWRQFETQHPKLLGALLDLAVAALGRLPRIELSPEDRPRQIEFARLGMALAEATGSDGSVFLAQFNSSREDAIARTIDASPVATAVMDYMRDNPPGGCDTAKRWIAIMDDFKPAYCENWPRSPKGFADQLRRAAPALRQMGIQCRSLAKVGGVIRWEIRPRENLPQECPASPESPAAEAASQDIRTFRTSTPQVSSSEGLTDGEVETVL